MIRIYTLFMALIFTSQSVMAQLPSGMLAPNFTGTDLDGNIWTLYDILDEGKSVLLDFSATWCSPCWDYHNQGIFKSMYSQYGPEGTDEMMMFFVEADSTTNTACLYGEEGCNNSTFGNWIDGSNYPIIDDGFIGDLYNVQAFPTLYHVCPSRTITEFDFYATEDDLYDLSRNCPQPLGANNVSLVQYTGFKGYFCNATTFSPKVNIQNFGNDPVSEVSLDLYVDGELIESINWNNALETFELKEASFSEITIDADTEVKIEVSKVNDQADEDETNNTVDAQLLLGADLDDNHIKLELQTDDVAEETYWELVDDNGVAYYTGGNPVAVGGVDNGESYDSGELINVDLPLPTNGCYELRIYDAYGDGICCYYGEGYFKLLDTAEEVIFQGAEFSEIISYPFAVSSGKTVNDNASIVDFNNRTGNFCFEYLYTPQLTLQNIGANEITSLDLEVNNNEGTIYTYTWSGKVASGAYLFLDEMDEITTNATTDVMYTIKNVNGNIDNKAYKNSAIGQFNKRVAEGKKITIEMQLDEYAYEIYWQLINGAGEMLISGGNEVVGPTGAEQQVATPDDTGAYAANALVYEEIQLPEFTDCYELLVVDDYGDGIFDPYYGTTYFTITDEEENLVYNFEDFDLVFAAANFPFGKLGVTAADQMDFVSNINIFPNPAADNLFIEFNLFKKEKVQIKVLNAVGQQVKAIEKNKPIQGIHLMDLDISDLETGMYFIRLNSNSGTFTKKINIIK